jgi:steroid delta-isomerase-like uncharacterized protein
MTESSAQSASRERREAIVREHWEAENRHDPDGVVASFSGRRASYDIPAFGPDGERPDASSVRELWEGMLTAFPDFHIDPGPMLHGDNHIFVEVRATGTQAEEFAGIPATGRSFDLPRVANLFEFEGDELVCERVYIDVGDMARQLMPAEEESGAVS